MGFRLSLLTWFGRILNLAGFPGWVRAGEYESEYGRVCVRVTSLYTVVTVNGVDVFFYRLTGGVDGVGVNVTHTWNYRPGDIPSAVALTDPPPSE
jgi:hypothetical protein